MFTLGDVILNSYLTSSCIMLALAQTNPIFLLLSVYTNIPPTFNENIVAFSFKFINEQTIYNFS
jgi:hypothetical protein